MPTSGACAVWHSSLCVSGWSRVLQMLAHHSVMLYQGRTMSCSSTTTMISICGLEANISKLNLISRSNLGVLTYLMWWTMESGKTTCLGGWSAIYIHLSKKLMYFNSLQYSLFKLREAKSTMHDISVSFINFNVWYGLYWIHSNCYLHEPVWGTKVIIVFIH